MNRMHASLAVVMSAATGTPAMAQSAPGTDLRWNSIDGGGSTVAGSGYSLSGTIGQADAIRLSGGAYTLQGGLHAGVIRCAADADDNGQVLPNDIAYFVQVWLTSLTTGDAAADFDGSGAVDPADIARFVQVWFGALAGGC